MGIRELIRKPWLIASVGLLLLAGAGLVVLLSRHSAQPTAGATPSSGVDIGPVTPPGADATAPPATATPTGTPTKAGAPSGHPTPSTTGVPAGTALKALALNDGGAYKASSAGAVIDGMHIAGDLVVAANNITIRNSQIDGAVTDEVGTTHYSFTLSDSTVGPATGCADAPGVGEANFTATRVLIRNHGDGFRASGDNINIQDSYVHLCSNPGDHSDGIQTYMTGTNLVVNHTTIDQRDAKDYTAPVFIADPRAKNVTVTNNLVMGGTYSIQVKFATGTVIVKNNQLVDKTWAYGPVESTCATIDWADNTLVTIDADYRVTSIVGPLPCAN